MLRRTTLLLALLAALPSTASTASAATPSCRSVAPTDVRVAVSDGGKTGVVRWRVPTGRPDRLAFRVTRDGAVVGQTVASKMKVSLAPSRTSKITVTAVLGGKPTRCSATARVRGTGTMPGAVPALSTTLHADRRLTLAWEPAKPGAHPIRRYQLRRDGHTVATLRTRSVTIGVPKRGSQRVQVAALDTGGRAGKPSPAVIVKAGHAPPKAPVAPAASSVTATTAALSWGRPRATTSAARIAGYRLLRRGRTVLDVKTPRATLSGLPLGQALTYRVVAVDALGWTSKPSRPVTVRTTLQSAATGPRAAPGAPGAPIAVAVSDTTISLGWSPAALPAGAQLRGYRLLRDGAVIRQVSGTTADVSGLAAKSAHDWSVVAVDTQGLASPPSPTTRVVQADPPPATGAVHAFLLASTDASFAAFREHYQQIGVVYPTFFDCNVTSGQIEGTNNPLIVGFAHDRKVKVLPRVNCQRTAVVHRILTDPTLRAQWLDDVTSLVDENDYDGLNLDFEAIPATDRDALTSFVADLADRLHARGKLLSQAVSGKSRDIPDHPRSGAFDYPALAQHDDFVFVMAWGVHWSTSTPGAQDDYTWVRGIRDYVATMPQKQKFIMGTMLYGMDWSAGGGPGHPGQGLQFAEIMALAERYAAGPVYDPDKRSWHIAYTDEAGVPHDVWYSDAAAVGDRVALAREQGLGVGFWRIGQEDEAIWADPRLPAAS